MHRAEQLAPIDRGVVTLIGQDAYKIAKAQNKEFVLKEIQKIEDGALKQELEKYVNEKGLK